ncbi:DUF3120 domain-containing protein [Okeania sp. SIO3B5]|uniref:DUF3120 domain-containing protein n=1 Tax=Okeania sp. SIO3B5 TaxID=2607811 RepID=UPI0034567E48
MVRQLPWLSLAMTGFWLWLSLKLLKDRATHIWGDLLLGFTWSWLTKSYGQQKTQSLKHFIPKTFC